MKVGQLFSRNNDINGNPYRLVVIYDVSKGAISEVYEHNTSSDRSIRYQYEGIQWIQDIHLKPSEYNRIKKENREILQHRR